MRWSYTQLSTYAQCPAKYKFRYKKRLKETQSVAAARGTDIHNQFEMALTISAGQRPNAVPEGLEFYADFINRLVASGAKTEHALYVTADWQACMKDDPNCDGVAIIDAWVPRLPVAYGYDWKTGKIYDEHQKQRDLYATVLWSHVPQAEEIKFSHVYTDLHREKSTTYTLDDLPDLREIWAERVHKMRTDDINAPNPHWGCKYCSFSKEKGGPCVF